MDEADEPSARTCQWCGTAAADADAQCRSCGAALATRDSLGGLVVPGVTGVDPALAAYDAQPWRIPKASPSQGLAGGTVAAAAMGGPAGLAALGGLAAVAAVEYLAAGSTDSRSESALGVGQPSEAALRMVEKLDAEGAAGDAGEPTEGAERGDGRISRPPGP